MKPTYQHLTKIENFDELLEKRQKSRTLQRLLTDLWLRDAHVVKCPASGCGEKAAVSKYHATNYFICFDCGAYGMEEALSAEKVFTQYEEDSIFCGVHKFDWQVFLAKVYSPGNWKTEHLVAYATGILMDKYQFMSFGDKEIYVYRYGTYVKEGIRIIERDTQAILKDKASNRVVSEVVGQIRRRSMRDLGAEHDKSAPLLCMRNGIFNTLTYEFSAHSPEFFFAHTLQLTYDPSKDCPTFKKFIDEVFLPQDHLLIQELMGFLFVPGYPYHKFFILTGSGRNGKGTFLHVLESLVGSDACCSISMQALTKDRFMASHLFGKKANIFGDMSAEDLNDDSLIKMLTGEDSITLDRKYMDPITFRNEAKIIVSCNVMPRMKDDTLGWWSRLVVIDCPYSFLGREDATLRSKLTTPDELSGIFNYAIEGLKRLRAQSRFSYTESLETVRFRVNRDSDPVAAFGYDCLERDDTAVTPKRDIYDTFVNYCMENGKKVETDSLFHKRLRRYYPHLEEVHPRMERNGVVDQVRSYKGIRLRANIQEMQAKGQYGGL